MCQAFLHLPVFATAEIFALDFSNYTPNVLSVKAALNFFQSCVHQMHRSDFLYRISTAYQLSGKTCLNTLPHRELSRAESVFDYIYNPIFSTTKGRQYMFTSCLLNKNQ